LPSAGGGCRCASLPGSARHRIVRKPKSPVATVKLPEHAAQTHQASWRVMSTLTVTLLGCAVCTVADAVADHGR
jgi:hypothetical protein